MIISYFLLSDFAVWRPFIARHALPYVLRTLTGLCRAHAATQELVGESCVPLLHKLEQFSSGNLVGVLAEDLLVALAKQQTVSSRVAAAIERMRSETRAEKKKLAMAMRLKQLEALGMRANDKGQLVARDPSSMLKTMSGGPRVEGGDEAAVEVAEEKGHVCCICREGYVYQPKKVLAIYTFSKKCELDGGLLDSAKATRRGAASSGVGHSTVTHFKLVHIDCHTNAILGERENAALQNANTKCNGILPMWGPEVTETVFSNALARLAF